MCKLTGNDVAYLLNCGIQILQHGKDFEGYPQYIYIYQCFLYMLSSSLVVFPGDKSVKNKILDVRNYKKILFQTLTASGSYEAYRKP